MGGRKEPIGRRQMVTAVHSTNVEPADLPKRSPADGFVTDIRLEGAVADTATADIGRADSTRTGAEIGTTRAGAADADTSVDGFVNGVVSRIPYPTLDQVARSVAIQRLQWLRHLPAPRTAAEYRVFQRIRTLGWSAPG